MPDPKGRTPLWYAVNYASGQGLLVREMVRRGARLPDDVLMGPVDDGDVETVRFLIRRGANVNCVATFTRYSYKFPEKKVLLTSAIENVASQRMGRALRAEMTPKWRATHPPSTALGDLESIPIMLIKAGAEVNRLAFTNATFKGFICSILGLAANRGLARTVKAMIAAGADVNIKDSWGGTPLIDAARKGHAGIVRMLLRAGARVDTKRRDGRTAVSVAREHGFMDLAEELQRHAKDPII